MLISRRSLLRAGMSAGFLALGAACGDAGVFSSAANRNTSATTTASTTKGGVGVLPQARPATKFAMVGDSITKASTQALTKVLTEQGFTEITIKAETSRRIATGDGKGAPLSGVKTLYTMLAEGVVPDVWVIALGTNDVGKYTGADEYGTLIDQLMTLPPAKIPIVWVDVYHPNQVEGTKVFNLALRDRAKARGNAQVVSWFDQASNAKNKILRTDRIHPNEKGTLVFADLVSQALR
jgi:lysophospholipase L1-like esterase